MRNPPQKRVKALPRCLREILNGNLRPREEVEWMAQPNRTRFAKTAVLEASLGILFSAITIPVTWELWPMARFASGSGVLVRCLFVIFLAGSAWLTLAPLREWWLAGSTFYMISNQRILVVAARIDGTLRLTSYLPSAINHIKQTNVSRGFADLVFRQSNATNDEGVIVLDEEGFLGIERADEVESRLRVLASKAKES